MFMLTDAMLIQMFGQDAYDQAIKDSTTLAGNGFYDIILALLISKALADLADTKAKLVKLQLSLGILN